MYLINGITSDPSQRQTIILPNGDSAQMSLRYSSLQLGWFVTNFTYQTFVINGFRIVVNPNILRQFKNKIPYGLACYANGPIREPTQFQDFSSGAFSLYILTSAEVLEYEAALSGSN